MFAIGKGVEKKEGGGTPLMVREKRGIKVIGKRSLILPRDPKGGGMKEVRRAGRKTEKKKGERGRKKRL